MTKFLHTGERTINVAEIVYVEIGDGLSWDGERGNTRAVTTAGPVDIPFPIDEVIDALHGAYLVPWHVVTVDAARDAGRRS